jgi:hypothetical protein
MSQNYGPIVHPWVIEMWTVVWWYWLGLTPNLSTRVLWQPPVLSGGPVSRDISGVSRRMGEGSENLVYLSLWDFKRSLTCHKILWHGTSGFTSHPKEGVLLIFITLAGFKPATFGSSAKHANHYTTNATPVNVRLFFSKFSDGFCTAM